MVLYPPPTPLRRANRLSATFVPANPGGTSLTPAAGSALSGASDRIRIGLVLDPLFAGSTKLPTNVSPALRRIVSPGLRGVERQLEISVGTTARAHGQCRGRHPPGDANGHEEAKTQNENEAGRSTDTRRGTNASDTP